MLIDTNAFLGPWPFLPVPNRSGAALSAHLAAQGIRRALVSPLGAVFLPEPMPANRELFAETGSGTRLLPVPVINPALAAWRDHLEECRAGRRLRAVRILPNYHGYSLRHRRLGEFMAALEQAGIRLVVTVRMEDERNRYFGLAVKAVRENDLAAFLDRFARHHVLCTGLYQGEIERLARKFGNFSADLSFAEWITTVESLLKTIPARRLTLGTATPLLSTHAETAKLRRARLTPAARNLIGSGNARRFFSI